MGADVLERLRKRARLCRANAAVRRWEYRQRHHARGVWFRLRRLLADAESAWRISADDAARLIADGVTPSQVGLALEPPMTILVVAQERLESLVSRKPVALRLGSELLQSRPLALVPFTPHDEAYSAARRERWRRGVATDWSATESEDWPD